MESCRQGTLSQRCDKREGTDRVATKTDQREQSGKQAKPKDVHNFVSVQVLY